MKTRKKIPLDIKQLQADSCTFDSRLSILHNLPFFHRLSHQKSKKINNTFTDSKYNSNDTIYFGGEM